MRFAYLIEPPFNYRDDLGRVTGCDVELARHVVRALGLRGFDLIETEFAELLPGLAAGKWEMTTGLFATGERKSKAIFSRPIWALADGLLVPRGNPLELCGYKSVASADVCRLAVIRDQFQHRSAVEFGVPSERILVFEAYTEAAFAVRKGQADAYASVARAHSGFLEQNAEFKLDIVTVPASEKAPAFGSFAFALKDDAFRESFDEVLDVFLGTPEHRAMTADYGFDDADIDLII